YNALATANGALRGLTEPVPLCTSTLSRTPAPGAYTKPLMLLIDEFTISTADSVANMIQSSNRGLLYGMRTNGAGGNNTTYDAGPLSARPSPHARKSPRLRHCLSPASRTQGYQR